ncbi:MAG: hypothetical protein ACU0BF_01700 [Paracoccaceae bacterium]
MITEADLAALIRAFAKATGWSLTYAARMATGSGDTVEKWDAGVSPTLRRANSVVQRCSELWPDNAPWPDGIPRPSRRDAA